MYGDLQNPVLCAHSPQKLWLLNQSNFTRGPCAKSSGTKSTKYMFSLKSCLLQCTGAFFLFLHSVLNMYIQWNRNVCVNHYSHCWGGTASGYSSVLKKKQPLKSSFFVTLNCFQRCLHRLDQWPWVVNMSKFLAYVLNEAKTHQCKSLSLFPALALLLFEAKANKKHFTEDLISLGCQNWFFKAT